MRKRPDRSAHTCKQHGSQLTLYEQQHELAFGVSHQGNEECPAITGSGGTPVHGENLPPQQPKHRFVRETSPELKLWFKQFYVNYRKAELPLSWVSIDSTPNAMYFAPDWWHHFKAEYLAASAYKKELLLEMLQEKLSGEKPSRHVQWPEAE